MTIEMARALLQLPEKYTRAQIDESYRQLRLLYEPRHYGRPHDLFERHIQEHMYQYLSGAGYKPAKGVQYQNIPLDNYGTAFLSYAKVCLAYDVLTNPKNIAAQKNREQDRFDKPLAMVRDIARLLVIPLFVLFFLCGALWTFGGVGICEVLSKVLLGGCILALMAPWLTQPLDTLLFIPKRIWNGIRAGASKGIWLTKPITIVLYAALYSIGGVLGLIFLPSMICVDREERLGIQEEILSRDRQAALEWYHKTKQNLQMLSAACGDGVISERMTYVQRTLQNAATVCRETRQELQRTIERGRREVRKAGKWHDQRTGVWGTLGMDRWEYEFEVASAGWELDDTVKREEKNVDEMRFIYRLAFRSFGLIATRLGVDPADYGIELDLINDDVTIGLFE